MLKIYHNPRCSKSRATLQILENQNLDFEVVEYLKTSPSKEELQDVFTKLNLTPSQVVRSGEKIFKELELKNSSEEEILNAMVEHPILIERSIVVKDDKAKIGRPPEDVLDVLDIL